MKKPADKGPSRLVNFGDFIIFLFLLPKVSLWCQYAIPRVPEILLTKKHINHRFYLQKSWCPRTSNSRNIAFWRWKPPPKPSKSCFSTMIYPRKMLFFDFKGFQKSWFFDLDPLQGNLSKCCFLRLHMKMFRLHYIP